MRTGWPQVPLRDLVTPADRWLAPELGTAYRQLGVRLWGEGAYEREVIDGGDTTYSRLNRVETDDLVVNKIWARNGSVAVVQPLLAGCLVSGEFPTFAPRRDRVLPRWLHWVTKAAWFWRECEKSAQGTSGKNRIKPEQFLAIDIPLPPLAEQRRIVDHLDAVASRVRHAVDARRVARELKPHAIRSILRSWFLTSGGNALGDYATVQSGYAFKSEWFSDEGIRLARNVNVGHGTLDWTEVARIPSEQRKDFPRFELAEGDILVSLDRPLISTGVKVAMVRKEDLPCLLLQRVGRFQIKRDGLLPEFLFGWLHSQHFTGAIDPGRSNGVPHISQKDIERIPFTPPPLAVQERAVSQWRELRLLLDEAASATDKATAAVEALLPAVLNRAFAGEL